MFPLTAAHPKRRTNPTNSKNPQRTHSQSTASQSDLFPALCNQQALKTPTAHACMTQAIEMLPPTKATSLPCPSANRPQTSPLPPQKNATTNGLPFFFFLLFAERDKRRQQGLIAGLLSFPEESCPAPPPPPPAHLFPSPQPEANANLPSIHKSYKTINCFPTNQRMRKPTK